MAESVADLTVAEEDVVQSIPPSAFHRTSRPVKDLPRQADRLDEPSSKAASVARPDTTKVTKKVFLAMASGDWAEAKLMGGLDTLGR